MDFGSLEYWITVVAPILAASGVYVAIKSLQHDQETRQETKDDSRIESMRTELGSVRAELGSVRTELTGRIDSVNSRIDGVNSRIDKMMDFLTTKFGS